MSESRISIIELAKKFKAFEVEYNLFDQQLPDGTLYWDYIRYRVYMIICSSHGIYENLSTALTPARPPLWKRLIKAGYMMPLIIKNDLGAKDLIKSNPPYVIISQCRFTDKDNNPVDLLMQNIVENLDAPTFTIELFRQAFKTRPKARKGRYFLYRLELMRLLRRGRREDWSYLNNAISEAFGISPKWNDYFDGIMDDYRTDYRFFHWLFSRIKPKVLFFQMEPKGMIAAANDLGILTVDQLHGHSNNVDMTYSYPEGQPVAHLSSLAKVLFNLGEFWNEVIDYPNRKINMGNDYFYLDRDEKVSARSGLMIVSARFVHDYLSKSTKELAVNNPDITFYYKMHSNQGDSVAEVKSYFSDNPNVVVVYTERSVKELMDECFGIALVQSSVSYQALQKGLKVFVFKTDYYEASYDIFGEPNFFLVDNAKALNKLLAERKTDDSMQSGSRQFFEPFNRERFRTFLTETRK